MGKGGVWRKKHLRQRALRKTVTNKPVVRKRMEALLSVVLLLVAFAAPGMCAVPLTIWAGAYNTIGSGPEYWQVCGAKA